MSASWYGVSFALPLLIKLLPGRYLESLGSPSGPLGMSFLCMSSEMRSAQRGRSCVVGLSSKTGVLWSMGTLFAGGSFGSPAANQSFNRIWRQLRLIAFLE